MPPRAKDPAAPKAAISAQQYYCKARREALRKEQPDLSGADLQKALADEWRDLNSAGRAKYVAQATADKKRYTAEKSTYVADPQFLKATKGGKRLQKDPLRPKKPKSAYLYFGEATRQALAGSNPGIRIDMLTKLIGAEWRKLTDAQKAPYDKMAEADQERYKKEMEGYTPSAEYLAARAAFKKAKKRAGKAAAAADDDEEEEEEDDGALKEELKELKKENTSLKRKVEKLEATVEKQAAKIEDLKAAKKAKVEKTISKPKAAKAEGKASGSKAAPIVVEDDAHYLKWTKKLLGADGEKADEEMLTCLAEKGEAGLVKLLAKRYKAEHK